MAKTRGIRKIHWIWTSIICVVILAGLTFYFWPETLPRGESQRIYDEAAPYNVIIIFNPGGWGDATLLQATDFTPILENIRQILNTLGYRAIIIPYARTPSGLSGKISDIKEYFNSFKYVSQVQAQDVDFLARSDPGKYILLIGFSNGGALTERTREDIANQRHINFIAAGVPGWYKTTSAPNSLVLNNDGQDTLSSLDLKEIAFSVLKAPFRWIWAKITGQNLSLGRAFQFPGHDYQWSSPLVGPPIIRFLDRNFKP